MAENLRNNPFAQLFPSLEAAKQYSELCEANRKKKISKKTPSNVPRSKTIPNQHITMNDRIEKLFGISLDSESKNPVVYLPEVAASAKQTWLDLEILEQALFERLFVEDPEEHLLNGNNSPSIIEKNVLIYLSSCYERVINLKNSRIGADVKVMEGLILRNMATALKPDLYGSQDIFGQFAEILVNCKHSFLNGLIEELQKDDDEVESVLAPFLDYLQVKLSKATLGAAFVKEICECLLQLAGNKISAAILMNFTTPKGAKVLGGDFGRTLLGGILNLSCLPKSENFYLDEYFLKDSKLNGDYERETEVIWSLVADLNQNVYQIFNALLRVSPEVNRKLVAWISNCLDENKGLGKIWTSLGPRFGLSGHNVSTGFMVNLGAVLLQLCQPIIVNDSKIMKIDPTFGAVGNFARETCLIPAEERPTAKSYNFITEIFFLAHKAVDLGFRVANELFIQSAQDMSNLNSVRRDARRTGFEEAAGVNEELLTKQASIMRSYYAAIFEPKARDLILKMNVATAKWIVQLILDVGAPERDSYHIRELRELTFPLADEVPGTLACVPEFIVENVNWHLALQFKVKEKFMDLNDLDIMNPIVTMIIVLTRGKKRVKNPHLRAGLIACLECLVPKSEEKTGFSKPKIFEVHPHINELVPSLLDVFVSIEMTGESVQFEQKFKYRQPIYVLIECLWSYEVHRNRFKALAVEAEANMEAVDPPIFLRFLNLLINDAVFLLDEALSNMAQLKTMELARESEDYLNKPARERQQDDELFRHTGVIARFDNILGKWTIKTLQFLTTEIKSIVTHPTMVDRVASMLNYLLHNFVGPNKKNLTVKDKQEYSFNPGEIVLIISQIYANLSTCDNFCLAISRDGRSYNPQLFVDAEHVLLRISGSYLVPEIREVAARVAEMASKQKRHDELMADAPEEFFDPIMSTIMTDPVILPTSHVTVDRATIARHLLSDQTDPFNRSPLSMDMVQPNDELRRKIETWTAERSEPDEK